MKVEKLIITNFGPFGEEVEVDFSRYQGNNSILVIADNLDSPGADSNGGGKTSLFNSLSWLLFDRLPVDVGVDAIIREGEDFVEVKGIFTDGQDREHILIRNRKRGGKAKLTWSVDGDVDTYTQRTTTSTQSEFLKFLGIMENNKEYYNDFLNTTYFSVDAVKAFAGKNSTSKDRMDLIARFLRLEVLERARSNAKVHINTVKGEIQTVDGKIEYLEGKVNSEAKPRILEKEIKDCEKHNITLAREKEELDEKLQVFDQYEEIIEQQEHFESNAVDIEDDYTNQASLLEGRLKDFDKDESERVHIESSIEKLNEQSNNISAVVIAANLKQLQADLKEVYGVIARNQASTSALSNQLRETLTCPDCEAELMYAGDQLLPFDRKAVEKELAKAEKQSPKLSAKRSDLSNNIEKLQEELGSYDLIMEKIAGAKRILAKLEEIPAKREKIEKQLGLTFERYEKRKAENNKQLMKIEVRLKLFKGVDLEEKDALVGRAEDIQQVIRMNQETISRNKYTLKNLEADQKTLKKLKEDKMELVNELGDYQFWYEGFPEIRKWMIESFLPSFEDQTNEFLGQMEVGYRVRFDTMKEGKKGQDISQFDFAIVDENNQKRELDTYSGGEKNRIGVCTGFALRELTLSKGYNRFDFLLMDEVIDRLDETGIGEFFELLNKIAGMKLLISHDNTLKSRFAHSIKVIKQNGISKVVQD